MSESSNNVDICAFFQEVYDTKSLLLMFNKFLCYIWKKISDIIHSSSSDQTSRDYSLTSAQAEDMFFTIERLVTKKQIKSRWFFLAYKLTTVKLKFHLILALLYKFIKLVYKSIIVLLAASKSRQVIDKMKNGESHKIDQSSDEGKAVIRHLGGWAVHAILAELRGL